MTIFLTGRPILGITKVARANAMKEVIAVIRKAVFHPKLVAIAAPRPPPKIEAVAFAAQKKP